MNTRMTKGQKYDKVKTGCFMVWHYSCKFKHRLLRNVLTGEVRGWRKASVIPSDAEKGTRIYR